MKRYARPHRIPIHWHTTAEADGRVTIHGKCRGHGYRFTVPKDATRALQWLAIDTITMTLLHMCGSDPDAKPVGLMAGAE